MVNINREKALCNGKLHSSVYDLALFNIFSKDSSKDITSAYIDPNLRRMSNMLGKKIAVHRDFDKDERISKANQKQVECWKKYNVIDKL